MTDWGASNRRVRFEFMECDPFTLTETGALDIDSEASSLSWGYYTDNLYSGTLAFASSSDVNRDRLVRVRQITEVDGTVDSRVIATMFIKGASTMSLFKLKKTNADCYSTLYRLTKDYLASDFWRMKGEAVVDAVKSIVEEVGGKLRILDGTPTDRTFGNDVWFELGTNRMTAVNTLAGWIDCQIACDGDGYVTIGPYIKPSRKPVSYTFEAGRNCTYIPGVEEEDNRADIVNRVIAFYSLEEAEETETIADGDEEPGYTARVVVELGEDSSFCYKRCGRYQTAILKFTEPMNEGVLRDKALTYLRENSGETRYYTISHVPIPGLTVGDVVMYENNTDFDNPVSIKCMVTQIDMALKADAMCVSKLKVV